MFRCNIGSTGILTKPRYKILLKLSPTTRELNSRGVDAAATFVIKKIIRQLRALLWKFIISQMRFFLFSFFYSALPAERKVY